MRLDWRPVLPMVGGLLLTHLGYIATYLALSALFLDDVLLGIREISDNPTQFAEGVVILSLLYTAVMLTLHLSGIPKPWKSLNRVTLALFIPYIVWVLSLLALAASALDSLRPVLAVVGHPLWFLAFFLVGLTWWIVEMVKARKRYLMEGWA